MRGDRGLWDGQRQLLQVRPARLGQEGRWGGRGDPGPCAGGPGSCGAQGVWASGRVVEAIPGAGAQGEEAGSMPISTLPVWP